MFSCVSKCQTVFHAVCTILYSYKQWMTISVCSTSSPAFGIVSILDFNHSYKCIVHIIILICILWCRRSFYLLICHIVYLLWEGVKVLAHFLNGLPVFLLLSFKSSLYRWDNSPLSDASLHFFSLQLLACLLILLW